MSDRPILTPNVLVGGADPVGRARGYINRNEGSEEGVDEWVVVALNGAVGKMEQKVGRKLRARTYRNPVTISCTATTDDQTLTAAAGLSALKTLDDSMGTLLAGGSRIDSITSDVALELSRKATGAGAVSVVFGSEPLLLDGDGSSTIFIPERPVVEVYSASWIDTDGTREALDLTGARLDKHTGRYRLPNDSFPDGDLNIEIECKAGILPPSITARSDHEEWNHVEQLCLRLCQVMFQDFMQQAGRVGDTNILQFTQHVSSFELPADIAEGLEEMVQPW